MYFPVQHLMSYGTIVVHKTITDKKHKTKKKANNASGNKQATTSQTNKSLYIDADRHWMRAFHGI